MDDATSDPPGEDPFAEADEWLAAEARQLIRAHRAGDAKAVEVALFYLKDFLTKTVGRHLRDRYPDWDAERWFDGLDAEPEFPAPGRIRLRGEVAWVAGQRHWYYDPFDFELELCPRSGTFRGFVARLGDYCPLADKIHGRALSGVPVGRWAYTIERRRAEPRAAADGPRL